jgi:lysophospholipase L1-like esterase
LRWLLCAGCSLVFIGRCQSQFRPPQVDITERDTVGYAFLKQDSSTLLNDDVLSPFFEKLYQQRTEGGQKITIVHIGDSHVLGNFLTAEVRERLQRAFGEAGRGLVFPYKLAGSNGPRDYQIISENKWYSANCHKDLSPETPFGISGFVVECTAPDAELLLRLRDTATSETRSFTKVTVFRRASPEQYELEVRDEQTGQIAQAFAESDDAVTYYFNKPVVQAILSARRTSPAQKRISLDGIALENEYSGVVYHNIGINGAKFSDFLRAKHFTQQLGELQPDLVILSFGTNESQGKTDDRYLYRQLDQFTQRIRAAAPGAQILFTTPADSYLRGKGFNPYMAATSNVIKTYALENQCAVWDLFELSGGEKSALLWKKNGLMSSDSVHYSKTGYAAQGKLLYQTLIKSYNTFITNRP